MNATLMSVDELRDLVDRSDTDPRPNINRWQLKSDRVDRVAALDKIGVEARGRAYKADEQRDYDRNVEAINMIDRVLVNLDKRGNEYAAQRAKLDDMFAGRGGDTGDSFGAQIRDAIGEVREGRATSYVNYPNVQTRALADNNTGGYAVNTVMQQPTFALQAASVIMNLPGVVQIEVNEGDRLRIPRYNAVSVAGVSEGLGLNPAGSDLDAVDVVFQKYSTFELLSAELVEDAHAPVLTVLGNRMLLDLAAKVDSGFLQGNGAADCVGIFNQLGVSTTSVAGVPTIAKAQACEYQLLANDGLKGGNGYGAWIMNPRSWVGTNGFRTIVTGVASSIQPVLSQDPSQNVHSLSGYPVFLSSVISTTTGATNVGSTAALADPSMLIVVTRRPARLEITRDFKFDTDQVAIRATTRVGLGLIDPAGGVSLLTDIRTA